MDAFENSIKTFAELSENPVSFLNGNTASAADYVDICSKIFASAKLHNKSSEDDDPLSQLHVNGFDNEQIWQQIELFNSEIIKTCSKGTAVCLTKNGFTLTKTFTDASIKNNDTEDDSTDLDEQDGGSEEELRSAEENHEEDNDVDQKGSTIDTTVYEKTEVDDEFFSLRQMEKFLEIEESGNPNKNIEEDVDYFDDIPSSDEEPLFDVPSDENNEFSDDEFSDIAVTDGGTRKSARHLKYHEFFADEPTENLKEEPAEESNKADTDAPLTNYEKQQLKLSKKINHLEERALGEADWQMKGETMCNKRPVNSLLEEVLTFDHTERTAPEITDDHTNTLEGVICQRIKDKAWDDVERKIKEVKNPQEFKKKVVLDSEQSKLSLQQIYEKEYIAKISLEEKVEKEDPAHVELKTLMGSLFKKLDALSNFHFQTIPSDPEIKVITNLPSIAMEEVQPITHTDADLLAPEEVLEKKELKGDMEKTSTDRKRERRKKVARQKVRAKARLAKLERLADTNDKLKTVQAIKKLEQAAKTPGSQTTIIKNSKSKGKANKSSKSFFSKLDEKPKIYSKPKRKL